MKFSRVWEISIAAILFICIEPPRHAQAYIDPGTGNYILQILLAALFGAMFALRVFWSKFKGVLARIRMFPSRNKEERRRES